MQGFGFEGLVFRFHYKSVHNYFITAVVVAKIQLAICIKMSSFSADVGSIPAILSGQPTFC